MRVYEFAKMLEMSNKDLIALLAKEGFEAKSHMAALSDEAINFLNEKVAAKEKAVKKKTDVAIPEQESRVAAVSQKDFAEKKINPVAPVKEAEGRHVEVKEFLVEPMTVGEAAVRLGKPINEVIITLLKHGVVSAKNQILAVPAVEYLARHYNYTIAFPVRQKKQEDSVLKSSHGVARTPVVVVLGHVDHGKTTLLDFIRKTRLAAKEKGGITQHLGAYEVEAGDGSLVFLDTPGHEAFSNIRGRGVRVADIAVLVVAADDSVMPQTIEAIKKARDAGIVIIVAINKVDRVDKARIDVVKKDLARYDLVTEDWGGDTICVPISAKTGAGVDKLLEMIILQSELMDLKADPDKPALGVVLESKIEKGRGPVATVICQQGTLRVGDFFTAGHTYGRVTSIVNSHGKMTKEVGPSVPVQIAGYAELPAAGDVFEVIDAEKYSQLKSAKTAPSFNSSRSLNSSAESLNVVVKVDTSSTKEALLEALIKISEKESKKINVVYIAVGNIIESDIEFAANTNSEIIGLHVKADPTATALANKIAVNIHLYDIIYKLLEAIQERIKQPAKIRLVSKKIGEAVVRKVFDIKNVGIIAGCYVKEGRFCKDGRVIVWRGKKKVGEGIIKGLERERKSVKEVHAGFEFAFNCDGFNQWEIDDRIECFFNMPEK